MNQNRKQTNKQASKQANTAAPKQPKTRDPYQQAKQQLVRQNGKHINSQTTKTNKQTTAPGQKLAFDRSAHRRECPD